MEIHIDRVPRDDGVELVVVGRLDAESAGELRHAVAAEVRRGLHAITLDLAAVTFLSSAGIRVLFETQREARTSGGECLVRAVSDPVRKVLELTRLDAILMRPAAARTPPLAPLAAPSPTRDIDASGVRLVGLKQPPASVRGRLVGSATALVGAGSAAGRIPLALQTFAIGIAAVADDAAPLSAAGESLAACGAVYHRPPRPFAAVDYLLGTAEFVPAIDMVTGLVWEGAPAGWTGFEPTEDAAAVALADLAVALLEQTSAEALAIVVVGEVHGLVAAELIRPLAEATPADHPLSGLSEIAARWLCFSREPVHAGRTALVVGVVTRVGAGPLGEFAAPLGRGGVAGHLHAVVFPHRPLRRSGGDLPAVVADLTALEPLAAVHLLADDRPVLGSGVSELVRGSCWFAPLALSGGDA
jgi:anti-sigma B factor antagonist